MLTAKQRSRILRDMKPLNEMLAAWRDELKISKSEAARRCGMSAQHWWQLETGERVDLQGTTFTKLAAGTGIPLERLMLAAELSRQVPA